MANSEHLDILSQGVDAWNDWRMGHPLSTDIDLSDCDLSGLDLSGLNLKNVNLSRSNLAQTKLFKANLTAAQLVDSKSQSASFSGATIIQTNFNGADLRSTGFLNCFFHHARLQNADLSGSALHSAQFTGVKFTGSNLFRADFFKAHITDSDFGRANLTEASFTMASLVRNSFADAKLIGCKVYGVSAWDLDLQSSIQQDIVITGRDEPSLTVDDIEIAQFIYLLLKNQRIRSVINTITTKMVLILGRFTSDRKPTLNALRTELRNHNYVPVLFDFGVPANRTIVETVSTLAHLSRFVIADFTDAKIVMHEVPHIVQSVAVPVLPLVMQASGDEPATLRDLRKNHRSVLPTYFYQDISSLIRGLDANVITPAESLANELSKP